MQINRLDYRVIGSENTLWDKAETGKKSFKSLLEQTKTTGMSRITNESLRLSAVSKFPQSDNVPQKNTLIHIGQITRDVPTVSELIFQTSYKKDCWNILDKSVNADKPFRTIRPGTDIYMDSKTSEIIWGNAAGEISGAVTASAVLSPYALDDDPQGTHENDIVSGKKSSDTDTGAGKTEALQTDDSHHAMETAYQGLDSAVSEFIGRDYAQMDCYELVVGGLKNMGFKYQGRDGLGHHLIDRAVKGGLTYNHYLNGEGLVTAAGHDVFKKTITDITSIDDQAENTMNEMKKVLQEGQILSFSTRTSGHTGIISRKDGTWTYINSGIMDNNVAGKNGTRAVGEETLENEVKNWIKRAGKKGEGLKISLGSIDISKLSMFSTDKGRLVERV